MRMFIPTSVVCCITWFPLLAHDVNIILSFLLSAAAITITASIITKIDFGHWNPF